MTDQRESSLGRKALQLAEEKVPYRIYELSPNQFRLLTYLVPIGYSILFFNPTLGSEPGIPYNILSASLFIFSALIDRSSTINFFKESEIAAKEKIINDFGDTNIVIQDIKNSEQFASSSRVKLIDRGAVALATALPGVGIPLSAMKIVAGLNNMRITHRYNQAIKIKHELEKK